MLIGVHKHVCNGEVIKMIILIIELNLMIAITFKKSNCPIVMFAELFQDVMYKAFDISVDLSKIFAIMLS